VFCLAVVLTRCVTGLVGFGSSGTGKQRACATAVAVVGLWRIQRIQTQERLRLVDELQNRREQCIYGCGMHAKALAWQLLPEMLDLV
jgi:hypothetical protein